MKVSFKLNDIKRIAAALLIVVVVALLMIFLNHATTKKTPTAALPSDWTTFKSQQYGFQFSYPKSWGKAILSTTNSNGAKQYAVAFKPAKATDISKSIGMSMTSADCKSSCLTKASVQNGLKVGTKNFVKYDSDSYAFVVSIPASKIDTMTYVQVVNLPKINVTAASLFYTLTSANNCPQNKFASNSKDGCITASDYSVVNQVVKSLQGV